MNSRFALPGAVALKPPNGGVSFCRPSSADLRSTGSFASAARLVDRLRIDAGEMLRPAGRGHRMRDRGGQPREQVVFARCGIAGFEGVEVIGMRHVRGELVFTPASASLRL